MSLLNQAKIAARLLYSVQAKRRISELLDKFSVDIAHLHNIYHEISPSILYELKKRRIPIVMTLHDYKMICASRLLTIDGKACEACREGKYFYAVGKSCLRSPGKSIVKSVLAASEMYLHQRILDIYDKVDLFIAPSLFLKKKLEDMGFKKKLVHSPHFVDTDKIRHYLDGESRQEESIVYFGRLSEEKGISTLLNAVIKTGTKIKIKIIGEGDLRKNLEEMARTKGNGNIAFLGNLKKNALYKEVGKSMFVVLPSANYENCPMSILEAFALGKTVLGPKTGSIPELIKDNETGLTFERGNTKDLSEKIKTLLGNPTLLKVLGENAQNFVKTDFNPEKHYLRLIEIYNNAAKRNKMDVF